MLFAYESALRRGVGLTVLGAGAILDAPLRFPEADASQGRLSSQSPVAQALVV